MNDTDAFCPKCGASDRTVTTFNGNVNQEEDKPSFGFAVLGFFIPLVGLILYLIWKDTTPQKAKSCGKGALVGVIVSVALSIVTSIITAILSAGLISDIYRYM